MPKRGRRTTCPKLHAKAQPILIAAGIHKMSAVSLSDVLLHFGLSEPSVQRVEQPWQVRGADSDQDSGV